ncbi:MAG: metal ABC transporter substrate-binding protein [Candidatus Izemoplasmatales bacterium]|nr:metal ABC transporter substrate-binding protein [Candidatus Izemoplasmatales bacterium]
MKKILVLIIILFQSLILAACNNTDGPHDIYVTVYPLKYVAEEILTGTEYTVGIVPGVTSHNESADWSPKEIIWMKDAKYLFYVGANYDYYIDKEIDSIFKNADVELVKIENETEYITLIPGIVHEHNHDETDSHDIDDHDHETTLGIDPHFWISPLKVLEISELVYDKLLNAYPEHEELINTNYTNLVKDLTTLNEEFHSAIANLTKPVMTSTNLYGYLEHDYGLNYLPISPGYHEESDQFTTQQKDEIVAEALYHDINYIIYEMYTNSPLSNAVFSELETKGLEPVKIEFHILQMITNDDEKAGKNYLTIMRENLELLKAAGAFEEE